MTLPRKKARPITVDGVRYEWLVGPNDGYNVFVAEKAAAKGRQILAYFDICWVNSPDTGHLSQKILTPRAAALIIRQALQLGWQPDVGGSPLVYDWEADVLIPRQPLPAVRS